MYHIFLTILTIFLRLSLATLDNEYRHVILRRTNICTENNQVVCGSSCMPPDAVCCGDGSGSYCEAGYRCTANGCCPRGEVCVGGGGTMTLENLTGTGSYPTATRRTTTPIATPTLDSSDNPKDSKLIGAASDSWNRGLGLPVLALMANQLVF